MSVVRCNVLLYIVGVYIRILDRDFLNFSEVGVMSGVERDDNK